VSLTFSGPLAAQDRRLAPDVAERFQRQTREAEAAGLAEPFRGVTTDGTLEPGLFPLRQTGVSTEPVREAALAFRASLSPTQFAATARPVDDDEWRRWMNQHFYLREGISFAEMAPAQRQAAIGLLQASLSAQGLRQTRDIMRLNTTLGELTGNFAEYGEDLYHFTMMGEPSATEPWGWQLDGHHLIINYFVLRDQVVMTPTFMGSEPRTATAGVHAGTTVLQAEESQGLALMTSLNPAQQRQAMLSTPKGRANNLAEAWRDNLVLDYAGIRATSLTPAQRSQLLELIGQHVSNMREGHARVRMEEVRQYLDRTYFAWIGSTAADGVFYYRVHSPVILIEFDHQGPIGLPGDRQAPTRNHVHSIVRTPNGNDYGRDLLRQHYRGRTGPHRH
jgi:hypothetical protein